jgi:hypothetical protein
MIGDERLAEIECAILASEFDPYAQTGIERELFDEVRRLREVIADIHLSLTDHTSHIALQRKYDLKS